MRARATPARSAACCSCERASLSWRPCCPERSTDTPPWHFPKISPCRPVPSCLLPAFAPCKNQGHTILSQGPLVSHNASLQSFLVQFPSCCPPVSKWSGLHGSHSVQVQGGRLGAMGAREKGCAHTAYTLGACPPPARGRARLAQLRGHLLAPDWGTGCKPPPRPCAASPHCVTAPRHRRRQRALKGEKPSWMWGPKVKTEAHSACTSRSDERPCEKRGFGSAV